MTFLQLERSEDFFHAEGPVIVRAWVGSLKHVYADGRLGCIQQTGSTPAYYRPTAGYTYGVGGYLLAGSELKRISLRLF